MAGHHQTLRCFDGRLIYVKGVSVLNDRSFHEIEIRDFTFKSTAYNKKIRVFVECHRRSMRLNKKSSQPSWGLIPSSSSHAYSDLCVPHTFNSQFMTHRTRCGDLNLRIKEKTKWFFILILLRNCPHWIFQTAFRMMNERIKNRLWHHFLFIPDETSDRTKNFPKRVLGISCFSRREFFFHVIAGGVFLASKIHFAERESKDFYFGTHNRGN